MSSASRLLRAWLLTGVSDATFSSVLVTVFYGSTFARLWQGVASTLLGPDALNGGNKTVAIGLLMHFGVALAWSIVFLLLYDGLPALRAVVHSRLGVLKVATVYGPIVWMVMSFAVIPLLSHRPPTINYRWWVQFFGHIPAVALPIVWAVSRGRE